MHTAAGLIDIHERTHRSLHGLLEHCSGFTPAQLSDELYGFGYQSILLQLHHMIGAEQYWVGVLGGLMLVEEEEADHESIEALRAFRERVCGATRSYLHAASSAELNTAREMTTWGGRVRQLVPAEVILRTQTHAYQHQGQVAAMARLLGRPLPTGLDYPLD